MHVELAVRALKSQLLPEARGWKGQILRILPPSSPDSNYNHPRQLIHSLISKALGRDSVAIPVGKCL